MRMRKPAFVFVLPFIFSFAFPGEEPMCREGKLHQQAHFPVGVALDTEKLKFEEKYWTVAMAQFNSFTPEMILKPQFIHPKQNVFNFNETDHLVDFCREHKIRLHGHTLIWHKALPQWMEKFKGSSEDWEKMMKDHIQGVISHCKTYIKSWDVVNEAFNDDGSLRNNMWLKNIGESYIEKAFRFAREADPDALLFYNDYSLEAPGPKLNAVLRHMERISSNGTKVDGIGLQMHVGLESPAISLINQAAQLIQKKGFRVHYSELDVSLTTDKILFAKGSKLLALQKDRVKQIVQGYMQLDPAYRFGITLWGVSDNDSWLTEDRIRSKPLLYNTRYKIKPAYCGFLEALSE